MCCIIVLLFLTSQGSTKKSKKQQKKSFSDVTLLDILGSLDFEKDIRISFPDKEEHARWKQQKLLEKNELKVKTPAEKCSDEVNKYTQLFLHEYPYTQMSYYSGNDISDMGNRDECLALGNTWFYVFQIGIKQLPLKIRVGYCFPGECNPDVMETAMQSLSDTVNELLAPLLDDPPVELPTDVVPEFKFEMISPESWKEEKQDSRNAYAAVY